MGRGKKKGIEVGAVTLVVDKERPRTHALMHGTQSNSFSRAFSTKLAQLTEIKILMQVCLSGINDVFSV